MGVDVLVPLDTDLDVSKLRGAMILGSGFRALFLNFVIRVLEPRNLFHMLDLWSIVL